MSLAENARRTVQLELQELNVDNEVVGPVLRFPADYIDAPTVDDCDLDAAIDTWQVHVTANDSGLLVGHLPIDDDRPERVLLVAGRPWRARLAEVVEAILPSGLTSHESAPGQRPALAGERCTCGRPAVLIYVTERFGDVGYCGIPDGGAR